MTNLATRITVAAAAIPLMVVCAMIGGILFFLLVAAISTLGLIEFFRLARERGADPPVGLGVTFGLAVTAAFFHNRIQSDLVGALVRAGFEVPFPSMSQLLLIILLAFIPILLVAELYRNRPTPARNIGTVLFGVCYISLFFGSLVGLRELFIPSDFPVWTHFDVRGIAVPEEVRDTVYRWGGFTVVALFAAVWVCDSAAYFAGLAFGRHKLFERVSPKKTWEGAVAGFAGAVAAFLVARALVLPFMSVPVALACGVIVGVFGQLGDMVESLIKRETGVKDSSGLIPGHGGVLDRFDSLLFASPLVFLFIDFIVF